MARTSIIQVAEACHVAGSCVQALRMLIFLNRNYEVRVLRMSNRAQTRDRSLRGNLPYLVAPRGQPPNSGQLPVTSEPSPTPTYSSFWTVVSDQPR